MERQVLEEQLEKSFAGLRKSSIELLQIIVEAKAHGLTQMSISIESLESIVRSTIHLATIADQRLLARKDNEIPPV